LFSFLCDEVEGCLLPADETVECCLAVVDTIEPAFLEGGIHLADGGGIIEALDAPRATGGGDIIKELDAPTAAVG
jgi:hypothetical protein